MVHTLQYVEPLPYSTVTFQTCICSIFEDISSNHQHLDSVSCLVSPPTPQLLSNFFGVYTNCSLPPTYFGMAKKVASASPLFTAWCICRDAYSMSMVALYTNPWHEWVFALHSLIYSFWSIYQLSHLSLSLFEFRSLLPIIQPELLCCVAFLRNCYAV